MGKHRSVILPTGETPLTDVNIGDIIRFPNDRKPVQVRTVERCASWPLSYMHINNDACAPRATIVETYERVNGLADGKTIAAALI